MSAVSLGGDRVSCRRASNVLLPPSSPIPGPLPLSLHRHKQRSASPSSPHWVSSRNGKSPAGAASGWASTVGPVEDARADCGSVALVTLVHCALVCWSPLPGRAHLVFVCARSCSSVLVCARLCFDGSVRKFPGLYCIKYQVSTCII